ncbi:MAG: NADH dehydrogenase (quinone) subunit D, partial [Anaerolineales bacterium]
YQKAEVMTDRMDYLNTVGNNLAYCLAIEKLVDLDVPERAQVIRVVLTELQRIASHLVWLATQSLDLAAQSVFLYCFREREIILDILELVSGQRMMTTYIRPGGVWRDVPEEFYQAVDDFVGMFPKRIAQYDGLLTKNPLYIDRTKKIGVINAEEAVAWGLTGPAVRGSGVAYDLRKDLPYSGYEDYDFVVPTQTEGDVYARYLVRMEEMRQSLRIVEQGMKRLKETKGAQVRSNNRKYVPPPRSEIGVSMESLIHHFKLWTEGFNAPKGYVYFPVESPRGELGCYLESDGGPKPYRVHFRTPSFVHLQALPKLSKGHMVADLVAIIGSIDIVLGDADR